MSDLRSFRLGITLCWAFAQAGQAAELSVVEEHGDRSTRINLVFLAEGYPADEMPKFASDAAAAAEALFTREPWREYRTYCNVYRIEVTSAESGCDNGATSGPDGLRDTWFETGFFDPGVPQWIDTTMQGETRILQLLNQFVPDFDIAVLLVNDAQYGGSGRSEFGGSGGSLTIITTHPLGAAVLEHELGHSFANLADEYDAEFPDFVPMEAPNTTARTARAEIPWSHWLDASTPLPTPETPAFANTVGLFEGSSYRPTGWYRPHLDSMMRRLNGPCGAVNREQIVLNYYARLKPVDTWFPDTETQWLAGPEPLTFAVTPKVPASGGGPVAIEWRVNGEVRGTGTKEFVIPSAELGNGSHTVTARVRDRTPFVRRDPTGLLESTLIWPLQLSDQPPASLATWRDAYGPDLAEPAHDGLCNLVKYALGLPAIVSATAAERPQGSLTRVTDADHLTLTVNRRARRTDVSYVVETSGDLVHWAAGAGATVTLTDAPGSLVVRDAAPTTAAARRFIRLKVVAGM